jgi:hypothetical protein
MPDQLVQVAWNLKCLVPRGLGAWAALVGWACRPEKLTQLAQISNTGLKAQLYYLLCSIIAPTF